MPELLISIPVAFIIIIACHEAGRLTLRIVSKSQLPLEPLDLSLATLAAGYVSLEFIIALLGHLHLLKYSIFWSLMAVLLLSALIFGKGSLKVTRQAFISLLNDHKQLPLNLMLFSLILLALFMDFMLTCTPTTAWDALTAHYPLPLIWLKAGGFVPVPDICYSEYPMASEMLFLLAFGLGSIPPSSTGAGALAANHITWFTGLLGIFSFLSLSLKIAPSSAIHSGRFLWDKHTPGLITACAFLSLPIVYIEEMEGGFIENFLIFLSITMLSLLLNFKQERRFTLLIVIGILAGGLLASKHSSLFITTVILLILIVWNLRIKDANGAYRWGMLGLAFIIALIPPSIWYIKSFLHTGDPAYPFISSLLNPDAPLPDIMYWSNPNVNRTLTGFLFYIPSLTWDESLVQHKFRLLSPYFIILMPFSLWWSISRPGARTIGLITWILILVIYILAPGEPRYILDAWVLFASLGACGLLSFIQNPTWLASCMLAILLAIPITSSLVDRTKEINNRIPTILGISSIETYMAKSFDIFPLISYVNNAAGRDQGVIMVDPRIQYVEKPYKILYPFPTEPTAHWLTLPDEELVAEWKSANLEYLLISYGANYRAIALILTEIAANDNLKGKPSYELANQILDQAPWIVVRASYAEPTLNAFLVDINHTNAKKEITGRSDRLSHFDCVFIKRILSLYEKEYLEVVFTDPRSGFVFRIKYPEKDL